MTPRQLEALDYVRSLAEHGLSPTMQQIAQALGMASKSGAHRVVTSLVASGHLKRKPNRQQSLTLPDLPDLRSAPSDLLRAELARRGEALDQPAPIVGGWRGRVTCAADTCGMTVPRGHLFCRRHWFKLPLQLRDDILRTHASRDRARYQELVAEARDIADACGGVL